MLISFMTQVRDNRLSGYQIVQVEAKIHESITGGYLCISDINLNCSKCFEYGKYIVL